MNEISVLIVDDEPHCLDSLTGIIDGLPELPCTTLTCTNACNAITLAQSRRIDLLITDLNMPGINGIQLIDKIRDIWPFCIVIILTAYPHFNTAKDAISRHVFEYITKLNMRDELPNALCRAVDDIRQHEQSHIVLQQRIDNFNHNIYRSLLLGNIHDSESCNQMISSIFPNSDANSQYSLVVTADPIPTALIQQIIQEEAGNGLIGGIFSSDIPGETSALMCLSSTVTREWLSGMLEAVVKRLASNGYSTILVSGIAPVINIAGIYRKIKQHINLLHNNAEQLACILSDDSEAVIPAQEDDYHAMLVRKITQYMDSHITEDLSLTQLSSRFGYSQSYISTIFHNRTGESLQQYVIRKRMKQIESLMLVPEIALNNIGIQAGFSSPSYFSRFVKRVSGLSPREYRRKLLEEAGLPSDTEY